MNQGTMSNSAKMERLMSRLVSVMRSLGSPKDEIKTAQDMQTLMAYLRHYQQFRQDETDDNDLISSIRELLGMEEK